MNLTIKKPTFTKFFFPSQLICISDVLSSSECIFAQNFKIKFIASFFFFFAFTNLLLLSMATHYTACPVFSHSNHEPPAVQSHFDGQKSRNLDSRFDNNLNCQKKKKNVCLYIYIYIRTYTYIWNTVEFHRDLRENFTGFDVPHRCSAQPQSS
jgi:hypothetical protein